MEPTFFSKEVSYKTKSPKPARGHFGFKTNGGGLDIEWYHCREQIAGKIYTNPSTIPNNNFKGYYFCVEGEEAFRVAEFINKVEHVLELAEFTTFYKTNRNYTIWCELPEFWTKCLVRASFYTMMLRAGLSYKRDNFNESLFSEKYVVDTKEAVKRFLIGYNVFNDAAAHPANSGWVRIFSGKSNQDIKRMLSAPSWNKELLFLDMMTD